MSVHQDLAFHLGENWIVDFEVNDGDGENIDITGATLQWRLASPDGTHTMTRTAGDGLTITSGATGLCTLSVTASHQSSAAVQARTNYQWEFRVTTSGGTISVQALGALYVHPSLLAS
jgi:hypothetical protein